MALEAMETIGPGPARTRRGNVGLAATLALCALAVIAAAPIDFRILFARGSAVPQPVREFAWQVIETRCNYQAFEREQRSFWAYDARATRVGTGVVYSINVLSQLPWMKTEPPAIIQMTVVDDGRLRLAAIQSSFVVCESELG